MDMAGDDVGAITVGDFVEVRGRHWIVEDFVSGTPDRHRLICIDDDSQGETLDANLDSEIAFRRLEEDGWQQFAAAAPDDPVILGAHLRVMRWQTASAADRKLFQAPFRAGIRLDAYQLLPLKRALDLPRANLLIADDVGLGKTVEAGLVARELLMRRRIDFLLVAAPSSMVSQWQDEMAQKFGLDFTIVDREHMLRTRRSRGYGANPWALGSCFAISHSLLSDEAYMAPLRELLGSFRARSLLILDEAHHAAPASGLAYAVESQLTRGVRDLAARFEHRLFLSATPHNGHPNSFATLLEILDPQRFTRGIDVDPSDLEPVMVRRLKEDLRRLGEAFPERHVEPILIDGLPLDAPELRLAAMLRNYWSEHGAETGSRLLLGVLQQRLFSSLAAFQRTLSAHRDGLLSRWDGQASVWTADNDAEDERLRDDCAFVAGETRQATGLDAALIRIDEMLAICDAHAEARDARIDKILEWISLELLDGGEWKPRRLIIFTEWEDTRRWLVRAIEGGLAERGVAFEKRIEIFTGQTSSRERDSIKRAFNAPFDANPVRILVCTDAAREGINLQTRCHDLIHFDLPWNPSRLEQRNGRIDRKLQPNPTVNCRYFVYAQRDEDRVLDALVRKTETIRRQLGPAGEVIRDDLVDRLARGIASGSSTELAAEVENADSERAALAQRDFGDDQRLDRLRQQDIDLSKSREEARARVGVDPGQLKSLCALSLRELGTEMKDGAFSVDQATSIGAMRESG